MTAKTIKQPAIADLSSLPYERPPYSFYRPHNPLETAFTGEITDPWTGEITKPPSMTKQSFVEECDINNILADYKVTGQIRHINEKASQGAYLDLPDGIDFQMALNTVIAGQASFDTLPSAVRSRFGNDPQQFLEFLADPKNQDEAIRLGLATKRPEAVAPATPAPSPVATPEKPAAEA